MRQCLFCDAQADSREDTIPTWIIKGFGGGKGPFHLTYGQSPRISLTTAVQKAVVVCESCNNGWMCRLEETVKPIISPLMHDISFRLDLPQQHVVSQWALKTAMVRDGAARKRPFCYEREMCETLRLRSSIPPRTTVLLARCNSPRAICAFFTDLWITVNDIPKGAHGCVATFVFGYLVIQVLTVVPTPENRDAAIRIDSKVGPWAESLSAIWPPGRNITWPPPTSFTIARPDDDKLSVYHLFDRWRIGTEGAP